MALESGKHLEKEIDGVRCKVIENGITKERVEFLTSLFEHIFLRLLNFLFIVSITNESKRSRIVSQFQQRQFIQVFAGVKLHLF